MAEMPVHRTPHMFVAELGFWIGIVVATDSLQESHRDAAAGFFFSGNFFSKFKMQETAEQRERGRAERESIRGTFTKTTVGF